MNRRLNVSASPHVRSSVTTAGIMRDVALALTPAALFGVYMFGFRAFLVLIVSMTSCVLFEYLYLRLLKKKTECFDYSALVTGLLLGMNLSVNVPLWVPILGSAFAIIVVKQLFGGLGQNFMNPALAARCFLLISVGNLMTDFEVVSKENAGFWNVVYRGAAATKGYCSGVDGVSYATPLAQIKDGAEVSFAKVFFGFTGGTIGETSAFLLLLGGIYLLAKKVISLRIPVAYLLSFVVFMALMSGHGLDFEYLLLEVCSGGLILGALFMATDYVTSPITPAGKIVFGIFLGFLTTVYRVYGNSCEGVSFAIITGNILVPLIEKVTMPRSFGKGGKANG